MALVMLASVEPQSVQVFGNWFSFKPGQIKALNDNMAHFLCTDKKYLGFVSLPDSVLDDPNSDETAAIKEDARTRGLKNRADHLHFIIKNLEVSVQKDLDMAGIKINATTQITDGELKAYRELAKMKASDNDESKKIADEVAKLKEQISGNTNPADPKSAA